MGAWVQRTRRNAPGVLPFGATRTADTFYWDTTASDDPRPAAGRHALSGGKIRALGEQATATLKDWRLLRKPRCAIIRITPPSVHAVLTRHLTKSDTRVKTLSAHPNPNLNAHAHSAVTSPAHHYKM